jgi:hypothetical protein
VILKLTREERRWDAARTLVHSLCAECTNWTHHWDVSVPFVSPRVSSQKVPNEFQLNWYCGVYTKRCVVWIVLILLSVILPVVACSYDKMSVVLSQERWLRVLRSIFGLEREQVRKLRSEDHRNSYLFIELLFNTEFQTKPTLEAPGFPYVWVHCVDMARTCYLRYMAGTTGILNLYWYQYVLMATFVSDREHWND